ncbi:MAG: adenylate/guanylate cyclase domain-containing protein [Chitinophagaceae bacterium]
MPSSRQLAAIMFADISGYTSLMQEDESLALMLRHKFKKKLEELINIHQGRIIEFMGDGAMCSFGSTIEAVKAALALQLDMLTDPVVPLRIGLHSGDVLFEEDAIYGDSVNIASRLESFALPGSIFISGKAFDDIKNQKDIQTVSLGMYEFKNVKEQVEIFAISNPGIKIPGKDILEGKGQKVMANRNNEKSIAVLPFVNMSNDPEQEYFSDGMAEEIINSLVHIKDLNIAGRTSSARFKGKNIDLRDVGEKLGVGTVLEGSIRKQGSRIRITAQLISVEDGFHIWSERYDRDMDDIFAIQDEIALAITEQLKITLLEKDREKITKTATYNSEAYELNLKGRFHLSRRGSSILTALQFFKQAIALDPGYALAYAGHCDALIIGAAYGFFSGKEVIKEAKQSAETAIKLDDTLGEAYFSLGYYYICLERKWKESKKNFLKAIELNPEYVQARSIYAMLCLGWVEGKFDEAEEQARIAIKREPLSAIDHADFAWTLLMARKFDEALAIAKTGIELDNNSFLSHRIAGLCYIVLQRYNEAIAEFLYLINLSNRHQQAITGLIWAYCSNGNIDEARKLKEELEIRSAMEHIGHIDFGISAAYLGDLDISFDAFEKAYNDLDPHILTIKCAPYIPAILRNDPRFQNLLERIGFPV